MTFDEIIDGILKRKGVMGDDPVIAFITPRNEGSLEMFHILDEGDKVKYLEEMLAARVTSKWENRR